MAFVKPMIQYVEPFDAREEMRINFFAIGGDQYTKIEARIVQDSTTITLTEISFRDYITIPAGRLSNAAVLTKIAIRIGNDKEWSEYSADTIIDLASRPDVAITNVTDGQINNSIYTFVGQATQAEGVQTRSYKYTLYDENGDAMYDTGEVFNASLTHTFTGLENSKDYFVKLTVTTNKGVWGESTKVPFHVSFIRPVTHSIMNVTCDPKYGDVVLTASLKQIQGHIEKSQDPLQQVFYTDIFDPIISSMDKAIKVNSGSAAFIFDEGIRENVKDVFTVNTRIILHDYTKTCTLYTITSDKGTISVYWNGDTTLQRFEAVCWTGNTRIQTKYVTPTFADMVNNMSFSLSLQYTNGNIDLFAVMGGRVD